MHHLPLPQSEFICGWLHIGYKKNPLNLWSDFLLDFHCFQCTVCPDVFSVKSKGEIFAHCWMWSFQLWLDPKPKVIAMSSLSAPTKVGVTLYVSKHIMMLQKGDYVKIIWISSLLSDLQSNCLVRGSSAEFSVGLAVFLYILYCINVVQTLGWERCDLKRENLSLLVDYQAQWG